LLAFAEPWLAKGCKVFFPKGRDVEAELAEAKKSWRIAFDLHPSRTQANARIVVVRSAQRLAPAGQRAQVARAP
jgi:16S rRNA (guanine527-N7)-methyltransferase